MSAKDCNLAINEAYAERLASVFGSDIGSQLSAMPKQAAVMGDNENIPYIDVGEAERPVLYVPGWTEGIVSKAPFGGALVMRGRRVILPGQNRQKLIKEAAGGIDPTTAQAANYLTVIADAVGQGAVDISTHSYGSVIFAKMVELAPSRFEGSRVVMKAPAGVNPNESLPRLAWRFARHFINENFTDKDFKDVDGQMFKAGRKNLLANLPRAWGEVRDMATTRIDFGRLMDSGIASLTILGYAEDKVFPHSVLEAGVLAAMEHGVSYATPYSLRGMEDGSLRGGRAASHNDEQFNPERVAGSVSQILQVA